ncbi:MAG: MarR family winged helix-turn-helix transcriptional regulator [Rhodospirillales bacterium]
MRHTPELPQCVCGALRAVTRAVTQIYDDALRPSGLRITQFSLLSRISRLGPVSAATLVQSLHADQTTLARALKLLERQGLVRRAPGADRRLRRIELTAEGALKLATARRLWSVAQRRMVALIGARRWSEARRRLGGLLAAAAKVGRAA